MRWLLVVCLLLVTSAARASGLVLAIVPFENQSGDPTYDALGRGLADMLTTDLSAIEGLTLVERQRLATLVSELELAATGLIDPATAAQMGRGVGARYVVVGSIVAIAPEMRIDARIIDVQTAVVLSTEAVNGPIHEFFLLEKELAAGIAADLEIQVSPRETARMGRVPTASFAAFLSWSRGLEAIDRGEVDSARDALQAALAADGGFDGARALLDGISERAASIDARRRAAWSDQGRQIIDALDLAEAEDRLSEVPDLLGELPRLLMALSHEERRGIDRRLLDLELPDLMVISAGPASIGLNEFALFDFVNASEIGGYRADVLTWGQVFLERFPRSNLYPSAKRMVDDAIGASRREDQGRAHVPRIERQARAWEARIRCAPGTPLPDRIAACGAWARLGWGLEVDADDGLSAWIDAAHRAGSDDELTQIQAFIDAQVPTDAGRVADVRVQLERARQRAADAEQRASQATTGKAVAAAGSDLARAGEVAAARRVFEGARARFPGAADGWEAQIRMAALLGYVDEAERIRSHAASAGVDLPASAISQVERVRRDAAAVTSAAGEPLLRMAHALQQHHQFELAGDAFQQLARAHPEHRASPAPQSLLFAAFAYRRAYRADLRARSRALYTEVAETWPDAPEGRQARSLLQSLPN